MHSLFFPIRNSLGVDQSLNATGWVSLTDQGVDGQGVLVVKALRGVERLQHVKNRLIAEIESRSPEVVTFEGYAMGIRSGMVFDLGEMGGVLKLAVAETKQPPTIYTVSPSALKKFITGAGNAKKDLMMLQIHKRFGLEFTVSDTADAFALALAGFWLKYGEVPDFLRGTHPACVSALAKHAIPTFSAPAKAIRSRSRV